MNEKLVLIGIDGLDVDLLQAKRRSGLLPSLARLASEGELLYLTSPVPPSSLAAWATLSSGVGPERHGLLLPEEPSAAGLRPTGHASWRAPPVWERLADVGVATASIGWPGTIPGAAWTGQHIDSRYPVATGRGRDDWPLPLDVAPSELREHLREVRVHPAELPPALTAPLLPSVVDASADHIMTVLSSLARTASAQAGLYELLSAEAWQALFVFLEWPTLVAAALGCEKASLPDAAWVLLDQAVGALVSRAPADACVLLASTGSEGSGFVIARGGEFGRGEHDVARSTLALAPSILRHFDYVDVSLQPPIQSGRASKRLPPWSRRPPAADRDARQGDSERLRAFGLVLPSPDPVWRARHLIAEAEVVLAGDPERAAMLADEALAAGDTIGGLGILAAASVAMGDGKPLTGIADRIGAIQPDHQWRDLVLGAASALAGDEVGARPHLARVERNGSPDDRLRAASLWLMLGRRSAAARLFRNRLATTPHHLGALLGLLSTQTVRGIEAEQLLRRVLALQPDHAGVRAALANLLRAVGRSKEADQLVATC